MTFDPDWCVAPGELLREELDELNITPRMLARSMNTTVENVEAVLNHGPLTEKFAHRLALALPTTARLWLNLERMYRDGLARGKTEL